LGDFRLTDQDFADLTQLMLEVGDEFCDGRVVSVLEGGYQLDGLAQACKSHVRALSEHGGLAPLMDSPEEPKNEIPPSGFDEFEW
jgi:acetoin utilization deacetylase AcuC-like enzyme